MVPNKNQTIERGAIRTSVLVFGESPVPTEPDELTGMPSLALRPESKVSAKSDHDPKKAINPVRVVADGKFIALLDSSSSAWIISDVISPSLNLSMVTKKLVKDFYLSEGEIYLVTKRGLMLLSWTGRVYFEDGQLQHIGRYTRKKNSAPPIDIYSVSNSDSNTWVHLSNIRKIQNSNKIYLLRQDKKQLLGLPSRQELSFQHKIIGISAGKYHCLCWDETGALYSWGCKSIALGYGDLPEEDFISKPRRVSICKEPIANAYAGEHYSLALGFNGVLYEWGKKLDQNGLNDLLLFVPSPLLPESRVRFVLLRAKHNRFGAITNTGQLYLWGANMISILNTAEKDPTTSQIRNSRLFQPEPKRMLLPNMKVIDLAIEAQYVVVITTDRVASFMIPTQRKYWNEMLDSIKTKWLSHRGQSERKHLTVSRETNSFEPAEFSIRTVRTDKGLSLEKAVSRVKSKQFFFENYKNQEKLFRSIMGTDKPQIVRVPTQEHLRQNHSTSSPDLKDSKPPTKVFRRKSKHQNNSTGDFHAHKRYLKNNRSSETIQRGNDISTAKDHDFTLRRSEDLPHNTRIVSTKMRRLNTLNEGNEKVIFNLIKRQRENPSHSLRRLSPSSVYEDKLQRVLERKRHLQEEQLESTIQWVESNTIEYREERRRELELVNERQVETQLIKGTLQKMLINVFLTRMLQSPLSICREAMIQNFGLTVKMGRIQRNIKKMFMRYRIKFRMKKMQQFNPTRFFLLVFYIKRFIKSKRNEKQIRTQKYLIRQIIMGVVNDKLRTGFILMRLNKAKLKKFCEWLKINKNARLSCMNVCWNSYLPTMIKAEPSETQLHQIQLPKNVGNFHFMNIYEQRIRRNPLVKLGNFLDSNPLFRVKFYGLHKILTIFDGDKEPRQTSQRKSRTKRLKLKFSGETFFEDKTMEPAQILPYSRHYPCFVRNKQIDLVLPRTLYESEKWVTVERNLILSQLEAFLREYDRRFWLRMVQYDREMALFIRDNYEHLNEKRWKYIIEYNKLTQSKTKIRKENDLKRIMATIGLAHLVAQDCLPQKQAILQEAEKLRSAPKRPEYYPDLAIHDFKLLFKDYVSKLQTSAKLNRRNNQSL